MMEPYNEKVDQWRIPEISNAILGSTDSERVRTFLSDIHQLCKHDTPSQRPTTGEILEKYKEAMKMLQHSV